MRRVLLSAASTVLIVASTVFVAGSAVAANPATDFTISVSGGTATIVSYTGTSTDVDIPAVVSVAGTDYPVTALATDSFRGNVTGVYLTSVIIPESVVTIGNNAFRGGLLTSVVIPNSVVSIGTFAFYNNNLQSVTFGDSITTLGNNSFRGSYLTSLTIPVSVTSIGNNTFADNGVDLNVLTSVIFEGNAPALTAANDPMAVNPTGSFSGAGPILYYYAGATGFSPMFKGYVTRQIGAATSSLSASPATALANGAATITLTATVLDDTTAPVAGVPIAFTVPAAVTASALTCVTGSAGTCSITLVSSVAAAYEVTAKVGADASLLTKAVTFTAVPVAPAFTAASPPAAATVGVAYTYAFAASGTPAPVFALATGALPAGLTLTGAGVLSGTPTAIGAVTFTVTATNDGGEVATSALTITVAAPVPTPDPARPVVDNALAITGVAGAPALATLGGVLLLAGLLSLGLTLIAKRRTRT